MARLLNRPMSGSTDLVNLLGQRGQQQAQSSLAMSQPWTAAAQNIGGQAAKTLTDRYAAEQARPAQAFKLMQALQTLEQGAESLKIAKSTETRAASDAAKMNVGGALLQASNMKNPAEQAAAYQKALGVMQQHDLTAFQAPQDTQWGTPAAYSYLRKTAYNLDDKLKPTSDRERILERKRQELGGDLSRSNANWRLWKKPHRPCGPHGDVLMEKARWPLLLRAASGWGRSLCRVRVDN